MFHTPNVSFVALQAEAAGLPLIEVETAGEKEKELDDLRDALILAREQYRIEGVVTGAILSVYQASRVQRLCHDLGLWCFNPLWHTNQEDYLQSLIEDGYEVIVVGVFAEPFDETWLGRPIDRTSVALLEQYAEKYGITLTGEGGEYRHSSLMPLSSKRGSRSGTHHPNTGITGDFTGSNVQGWWRSDPSR